MTEARAVDVVVVGAGLAGLRCAGVLAAAGLRVSVLEASDGEGAVWRVFVGQWWDRFGTAEVGTSDLYELALSCEPPLPLGTGGVSARVFVGMRQCAPIRPRCTVAVSAGHRGAGDWEN